MSSRATYLVSAFIMLASLVVGATMGIAISFAAPWSDPADTPPLKNADKPINSSANSQYKSGSLQLQGNGILRAYSNVVFDKKVEIGGPVLADPESLAVQGNMLVMGRVSVHTVPQGSAKFTSSLTTEAENLEIVKDLRVKQNGAFYVADITYQVSRTCNDYSCSATCNSANEDYLVAGGCASSAGPNADHDGLYGSYPSDDHKTWICLQQRAHPITAYVLCSH